MKTRYYFKLNPCQSVKTRSWQPDTETAKRPSFSGWILLIVLMLTLVVPLAAFSKGPPPGKGGGQDSAGDTTEMIFFGDVFGDLIHIYRDELTGQPIYAQRWVELPADPDLQMDNGERGYGWGYCPIGLTQDNTEIPFQPYSCDLDPNYTAVAVDYFGRLNGARTRENNLRMHFNEVISNINDAIRIKLGPVGRLMLQFCVAENADGTCDPENLEWSTIDSPQESLGLYTRLMRYGHIATDPAEVDDWWHGDTKTLIVTDPLTGEPLLDENGDPIVVDPVHPSLTEADFDKFVEAGLGHLLPAGNCWPGDDASCADPEALSAADFNSAAIFLGAAGSKTRWASVDLVQYVNRFLRISLETDEYTPAESLPAKYRDCWSSIDDPDYMGPLDEDDPLPTEDLVYDLICMECNADGTEGDDASCPLAPPNADLYVKMQERFMNFGASDYSRNTSLATGEDTLIMPYDAELNFLAGAFSAPQTVDLLEWIEIPNPLEWIEGGNDYDYRSDIANFVIGTNDALRSIEFIHNYAVPADLYCEYLDPEDETLRDFFNCPTID